MWGYIHNFQPVLQSQQSPLGSSRPGTTYKLHNIPQCKQPLWFCSKWTPACGRLPHSNVGFRILELSKLTMYKFYYDCLKPKYQKQCTLLFTDRDGYGVYMTTDICKGTFICEYSGILVEPSEADKQNDQTYIYFFQHRIRAILVFILMLAYHCIFIRNCYANRVIISLFS